MNYCSTLIVRPTNTWIMNYSSTLIVRPTNTWLMNDSSTCSAGHAHSARVQGWVENLSFPSGLPIIISWMHVHTNRLFCHVLFMSVSLWKLSDMRIEFIDIEMYTLYKNYSLLLVVLPWSWYQYLNNELLQYLDRGTNTWIMNYSSTLIVGPTPG